MSRFVGCGQRSTMTSSPSSFIPFGAWAIRWMSRMTNRSAIARRPASLASRVTLSMGVAMAAAFLMFNWVSVRSLDQHFVEMDEHVLWGVFDAVIRALGEVHSEGDDEAL